MPAIVHQRCYNHALREAVARCPECKRHFCRECITEHDDRVLCSTCLAEAAKRREAPRRPIRAAVSMAQGAVAFVVLWMLFYLVGAFLLEIPSAFHETTIGVVYDTEAE